MEGACIVLCNRNLYIYLIEGNDNLSIASEAHRIMNNIAAAYTACDGKGAIMPSAQNSANLAETINSISQESDTEVEPKYVNFIDVDGTRLYSYTESEIQSLSSLPQLPTREGYTYQGWNWTLSEILAYGFPLTVGAVRVPSDGKTHYTFDLQDDKDLSLSIPFSNSNGGRLTVDWGDGTEVEYSVSPAVHQYASVGYFNVRISGNKTYSLIGRLLGSTAWKLVKAELSVDKTTIIDSEFLGCDSLSMLSLPNTLISIGTSAFAVCRLLRACVIPSSVTTVGVRPFENASSLRCVSLPERGDILSMVMFISCCGMQYCAIPNSVTQIGVRTFENCYSLQRVLIPKNVTAIGYNMCNSCQRLKEVDLSALTVVPTLENTNAFSAIPYDCVFYVRNAAMLSAFQSATNWSAFASKMQIGGKYAEN